MSIGFQIAGELPESIRMMDSAYRRGVAMQKLKMLMPLLPYLPESGRAELLNSPAFHELLQESGIGQLPQFSTEQELSPLDIAKQEYYQSEAALNKKKAEGLGKISPMDTLKMQLLQKKLKSKDYITVNTPGGTMLINKHDPTDRYWADKVHVDSSGKVTVNKEVVKEPQLQWHSVGNSLIATQGRNISPGVGVLQDPFGNRVLQPGVFARQAGSAVNMVTLLDKANKLADQLKLSGQQRKDLFRSLGLPTTNVGLIFKKTVASLDRAGQQALHNFYQRTGTQGSLDTAGNTVYGDAWKKFLGIHRPLVRVQPTYSMQKGWQPATNQFGLQK